MYKKIIIFSIASCFALLSFLNVQNCKAKGIEPIISEEIQETTQQTTNEKLEAKKKLKKAEKYVKKKYSKNMLMKSYNQASQVSCGTCVQARSNWCGPATAYNVCQTKNQGYFAELLCGKNGSGAPFPGAWRTVLNMNKRGNNYQATWAHDFNNWRSKLKNCVIYTIDKGYPLVADCHITSDPSTKLCSGYSKSNNCYHYVSVAGYDDLPNTIPATVLISDSHPSTSMIPRKYWTSLDALTNATRDRGIVW